MLKIGEFSKLSQLTVKALRFYEREGILAPSEVDPHTGYRLYTTSQLMDAAKVKSPRVAHSGTATSSACCTLPCVESMT